jgi:hypothetical protein
VEILAAENSSLLAYMYASAIFQEDGTEPVKESVVEGRSSPSYVSSAGPLSYPKVDEETFREYGAPSRAMRGC